jgi:hypothetical protein
MTIRHLALTLFVATACSGSDSQRAAPGNRGDAGEGDVAIGPDSSGLTVAHAYDVLVERNYEVRCAVCPCGAFVPATPQGEACTGAILDQYPDAKTQALCKIDGEEQYGRCLADAADCAAADSCSVARAQDAAMCAPFDDTAAMKMPPVECQGLSM